MIRSMTGFGQASRTVNGYKLHIDVKSVNHRYCEIVVRMPREWFALEDTLKKQVQQSVKRGRVDIFVQIEPEGGSNRTVEVDWPLLEGLRQASEQIRQRLGMTGGLSLQEVLAIPDLIRFRENDSSAGDWMEEELTGCMKEAVAHLLRMRSAEGGNLSADLQERLLVLEAQSASIGETAPTVVEEYRTKLRARIEELLRDAAAVDEQRLAMEVALMADRSNIDEELTRLQSHIQQFRQLLMQDDPVGRKLDFLIQEMNREVNTIGSKAGHTDIVNMVVEMKAELEKIREQVQNVE